MSAIDRESNPFFIELEVDDEISFKSKALIAITKVLMMKVIWMIMIDTFL